MKRVMATVLHDQPLKSLWRVFALLFLVALALNVLAFLGGVARDIPKQNSTLDKRWFGYYSTAYWSINYLTILPFGIGCCVAILQYVKQLQPKDAHWSKWVFILFAICLAAWIVGGDLYRVLSIPPKAYVQWNHISADDASFSTANHFFRMALIILAYAYYLTGYATFLSMVASVAWLATSYWPKHTASDRELATASKMMQLFRISILILLIHFTVVRVCKVEMYFVANNSQIPAFNPFKFKDIASEYLERISKGLYFDLALLACWMTILFYCHMRFWQLCQKSLDENFNLSLLDLEPEFFSGAAEKIGKPFTLLTGVLLFGIVFPPPSRRALLSLCGFLLAGCLVKQGLSKPEE